METFRFWILNLNYSEKFNFFQKILQSKNHTQIHLKNIYDSTLILIFNDNSFCKVCDNKLVFNL